MCNVAASARSYMSLAEDALTTRAQLASVLRVASCTPFIYYEFILIASFFYAALSRTSHITMAQEPRRLAPSQVTVKVGHTTASGTEPEAPLGMGGRIAPRLPSGWKRLRDSDAGHIAVHVVRLQRPFNPVSLLPISLL